MNRIIDQFDTGFRLVILAMSLSLVILFLLAGARSAFAATVKPVSTIEGALLTAGDVFAGITADKASFVLGPAPLPGKDMVLDSRTLYRIASALNLPWRPQTMTEQAVIRRAATIVDSKTIRSAVSDKLHKEGIAGRFNITFTGQTPQIVLPHDQPAQMEITKLKIDHQNDRFEATIAAPSAEHPITEISLSGTIERLVSVPVLKNTIRNGTIIGASDIAWIELPERDVQYDILTKEDALLGMTARRAAAAGKPLRANELQPPMLVSRGDKVTIVLKNNDMTLTAHGKALQSGAKGDIIRVVNASSNRSLEAVISGDRTVYITQ